MFSIIIAKIKLFLFGTETVIYPKVVLNRYDGWDIVSEVVEFIGVSCDLRISDELQFHGCDNMGEFYIPMKDVICFRAVESMRVVAPQNA